MERMRSSVATKTIPERVKQFYYRIGLICSTYPVLILSIVISTILVSCYPLLFVPLPGGKPQEFTTVSLSGRHGHGSFEDMDSWPRWLQQQKKSMYPLFYLQQIVIKSYANASSGDDNEVLRDSFKHVFPVTDAIRSIPTLPNLCFRVGEIHAPLIREKSMLPENRCLVVSPANFWQQDFRKFHSDNDIVSTILNYQSYEKGRSGLAEILLGMSVHDAGLKPSEDDDTMKMFHGYRSLEYAVTLMLRRYDPTFIQTLESKLQEKNYNYRISNTTSYIYYPTSRSYIEFIPIIIFYFLLFTYIYFSVKKIEIIHSKFGVTFSALVTIVSSLCMSIGFCTSLGLMMNVNISTRTIFPYFIGIVGLENILVMTRSVISTNTILDVKIRFAQGLSKEGWSITKNLLTEVTILTIGFFTFFPRIQEFCILASVGLVSDFFLQTFFYGTILSVDIRRYETLAHRYTQPFHTPVHSPVYQRPGSPKNGQGSPRHKRKISQNGGANVVLAPTSRYIVKLPKRLRLVYFWAKTRFFQRTFMVIMIGWISVILYEVISMNFIVESDYDILLPKSSVTTKFQLGSIGIGNASPASSEVYSGIALPPILPPTLMSASNFTATHSVDDMNDVLEKCSHWQSLVSIYNVSFTGRYLQVLPPINIYLNSANMVSVKRKVNWNAIASGTYRPGLVSEFFYDANLYKGPKKKPLKFEDPYMPHSPMEIFLTVLFAVPSVSFIAYGLVVFYRCICSRNYAEWRSSWNDAEKDEDQYTEVIFDAVPQVLEGHEQEVECMGCDGNTVVSVCLNGVLKVWNSNAENIASVDRKRYFEGTDNEESDGSDDEGHRSLRNRKVSKKMSKEPVWCLDVRNRIVVLGTGTGRLEIWDTCTGSLKGVFSEGIQSGIVCVKIVSTKILVARLNGCLGFVQLESLDDGRVNQGSQQPAYHRYDGNQGMPRNNSHPLLNGGELTYNWDGSVRAHQQPITCLECEGGVIVTGSQDHSLKVFRLSDKSHLYTLHGHYGPITCLFIDKQSINTAGSGSQDGLLCVWDLQTGTCVYTTQAHDGPITGLTYSTSYVISVGGDDKICVWERFQGHLLHTIQLDHTYCSSLVMLTHNLLITSKQGSLIVWDVQSGEPIRSVRLGHRDNSVFVRQILSFGGAVVCDYGSQLRLVRFPSIINKYE